MNPDNHQHLTVTITNPDIKHPMLTPHENKHETPSQHPSKTNSNPTTPTTSTLPRETMKLPIPLTFGPFPITSTQAFHLSPTHLSYALVNLRPLLPGHTLVCPVRRVPRLSHLTDRETTDLFLTVKRVSAMLERVYHADALNVAVQDGAEAGQSVNHVHVHLIPRWKGDCEEGKGDEIYERMDGEEGNLGRVWEGYWGLQGLREEKERIMREGGAKREFAVDEGSRRNRTEEEMGAEAEMLRGEMEKEMGWGRIEEGRGGVDGPVGRTTG